MLAMATACRLARLRRKGADEAPPGEDGVILLLAHPAQLEMAADVVEAIETTVGAVACWRYDDQDRAAALRAVTPEDVAGWRAAREPDPDPEPDAEDEALRPVIVGIPAQDVAPRRRDNATGTHPGPRMPAGAQPTLRLVGDEPDPAPRREVDEDEAAEMPEEPDPGTLLTEEELMMLLSSDPTEWEAEADREDS
jgi:hypothetical protein